MEVLNVISTNTNLTSNSKSVSKQPNFEKVLATLMSSEASNSIVSTIDADDAEKTAELVSFLESALAESDEVIELENEVVIDLITKSDKEDEQLDLIGSQLISNLVSVKSENDDSNSVVKQLTSEGEKELIKSISEINVVKIRHDDTSIVTIGEATSESKLGQIDESKRNIFVNNLSSKEGESKVSGIKISENPLLENVDMSEIITAPKLSKNEFSDSEEVRLLNNTLKEMVNSSETTSDLVKKLSHYLDKVTIESQETNEYLYTEQEQAVDKSSTNININNQLVSLIEEFIKKDSVDKNELSKQIESLETIEPINSSKLDQIKSKLLKVINYNLNEDKVYKAKEKLITDEKSLTEVKTSKVSVNQYENNINKDSIEDTGKSIENIEQLTSKSEHQFEKKAKETEKLEPSKNIDRSMNNEEKVTKPPLQLLQESKLSNVSQKVDTKLSKVEKSEVVKQVIDKIDYEKTSFSESVKIQLKPKELGKLELEVTRKNGKIEASLIVESEEVKAIIKDKSNQLIAAFERKNMQLSELKMIVRKQSTSNTSFNFSSSNGKSNQQYQQRQLSNYASTLNNMQEANSEIVDSNLQSSTKNYSYYGNSVNIFV